MFWLKEGDLNTKFFHQRACNRRRKNVIKGLFNEAGVWWCTEDEDLEGIVLHFSLGFYQHFWHLVGNHVVCAVQSFLGSDLLLQNLNKTNVSIWHDPWLPLAHNFIPFTVPPLGSEDWCVDALIDQENMEWRGQDVKEMFTTTEAALILKLSLSLRSTEDRLIWHHDKHGLFTV